MKKWISTLSFYSDKHLYAFLAWFIAGVLLLAVITKLLDPLDFLKVIIQHSFVPDFLARPAAFVTVSLELLIIYLLADPEMRHYGAPAAFLLFFGFTVFKGYHLIFNTGASCGCFGALGPDRVNLPDILMNIILIIFCAMLWQKYNRFLKFVLPEKSRG